RDRDVTGVQTCALPISCRNGRSMAGVMVLRVRRPDMLRPFRMWLYPLPALLAIAGFTFILVERKNFLREIRYAIVLLVMGVLIYLIRSWRRREWPFAASVAGFEAAG